MPAGAVTRRRSRAELAAVRAELQPEQCSCGHFAVSAHAYYSNGSAFDANRSRYCVDCVREMERERQRAYRGGQAAKPLKSAGHARKRPQRSKDPKIAEAQELEARARKLRAEAEAKDPSGYVYCVAEEPLDPGYRQQGYVFAVKVGESSSHPRFRLSGLQTGNPRHLKLLGYLKVPDRLAVETALHTKYHHLNTLGEWFRPTAALMSEFGLYADGTPIKRGT